jgi:hypothetical protein
VSGWEGAACGGVAGGWDGGMLEPGGGLANKPIKDLQVFGEGGCLRFLGSLRWGEGGGGGHIQARQDNLPACHPYDRRPLPRRQAQSTTTPHPLPFLILQVVMATFSTSVRPRRPPCRTSWSMACSTPRRGATSSSSSRGGPQLLAQPPRHCVGAAGAPTFSYQASCSWLVHVLQAMNLVKRLGSSSLV